MGRIRRLLFETEHSSCRRLSDPLVRVARIAYLALREFRRDYCLERSATLAFATVLSLIPLAVLVVSFAVQLGVGNRVIAYAKEKILPLAAPDFQETLSRWLEENISRDAFAKGLAGFVGLIALVGLLLGALGVFVTAERNFNRVWKVRGSRSYLQKMLVFWALLTTSPFLFSASASVEQLLVPAGGVLERIAGGSLLTRALYSAVVPVAIGFIGFSLLYVFLPNTKVRFRSASVGGVVAASLWLASTKTFYLYVARTSSIYGSLAIFPLFLLWLFLAWAITLLGCELAYVHQNLAFVAGAAGAQSFLKPPPRPLVALCFLESLARTFFAGEKPPSPAQVAKGLGLPLSAVAEVAETLLERGVVGEVSGGYCLLVAPDRIALSSVVVWFQSTGREVAPGAGERSGSTAETSPALAAGAPGAVRVFQAAKEAFAGAFEGRTLASLVQDAIPRDTVGLTGSGQGL